jgi:thioredoxin reductase (NADPH)
MATRDLVIVGAGPAGLTSAIYAGRARLSTLLVEMMAPGGWAAITDMIENYPGAGPVKGSDLVEKMVEQATGFGAEFVTATVSSVEPLNEGLAVVTGALRYEARAVVVASGTTFRKLGVPGEDEFEGRGVSYCATCDGPLFRGLDIAVVGGGDSALQEALYLTRFARRVSVIHRREGLRAAPVLVERVRAAEKITLLLGYEVERITGGAAGVESVGVVNAATGDRRALAVAGVFLFVGLSPRTEFLGDLVKKDPSGFIVTDAAMKTSVRGVFAAGDCRAKLLRQVSTAVGDGATAAFAAEKYLEDGEWQAGTGGAS